MAVKKGKAEPELLEVPGSDLITDFPIGATPEKRDYQLRVIYGVLVAILTILTVLVNDARKRSADEAG